MAAAQPVPPVSSAAHSYAVGREKIREYAHAVGETNPLYHDLDASRAAGHADLVAPPMFAVVYCAAALEEAMFHPEAGIDFEMLLHGGQEFTWGPLVIAGDEITTRVALEQVYKRLDLTFYVFESSSRNQRGEDVSHGRFTEIVRPRA